MARYVPTVALRKQALFPGQITQLTFARGPSVSALDAHLDQKLDLVCVLQTDPGLENPGPEDVAKVGVLARVHRTMNLPDGGVRALVEVGERCTVSDFHESQNLGTCCTPGRFVTQPGDPKLVQAATKRVIELARDVFNTSATDKPPDALDKAIEMQSEPGRVCDHLASQIGIVPPEAQELLAEPSLVKRLERLAWFMERAQQYAVLRRRIADDVQKQMDAGQREYQLREQLKAIQKELGETVVDEVSAYDEKIRAAGMPEEVEKEARRELERLKKIHVDAAEYMVARTYLDWLVAMPWQVQTEDNTSLHEARTVLDEDHYGLDKIKERLLEFLAVRQLKPDAKSPILCFVGPPGVGKTSLGKSIARALGRKCERIALGGMKDEAEIRGHRRTYVGALPGRVIQSLKRAGTKNPVIILDELDKIGNDFRGDPASALLEVLDPEQNSTFRDHYLDAPFDLSNVLFVGTANVEDPIPAALHDRLEIIRLHGYIEEEKLAIAQQHLYRRLREAHGIAEGHLDIPERVAAYLIRSYTREAGVRSLERELASLFRKTARRIVEGDAAPFVLDEPQVTTWLGPPKHHPELAERTDRPGIAIGLAWTESGGEILFIEATRMPGPRGLKITGSLGNVMKESCEAAMSFVRERAAQFGLEPSVFADNEYHLHMPAGAIPKDGPSAGVVLTTALVSLLTGVPVRSDLAMTGEITLRGKVLPVGGIKEKVLAARRAGIKEIVMPRLNERDLHDVPKVLRDELSYHFVDDADEALALALGSGVFRPVATPIVELESH
ncbi:MAG: endopeptidase La [Deltaproteobacteria bacterium]|nr:endopeptidase La [Deltaproteobacteria bacterium]